MLGFKSWAINCYNLKTTFYNGLCMCPLTYLASLKGWDHLKCENGLIGYPL